MNFYKHWIKVDGSKITASQWKPETDPAPKTEGYFEVVPNLAAHQDSSEWYWDGKEVVAKRFCDIKFDRNQATPGEVIKVWIQWATETLTLFVGSHRVAVGPGEIIEVTL